MFEAWVEANENLHTQRAYRQAGMLFVEFMGIRWPEEDYRLVRDVAVSDVRAWRDQMKKSGTAPSTRIHRQVAAGWASPFQQLLDGECLLVCHPMPSVHVPSPPHHIGSR